MLDRSDGIWKALQLLGHEFCRIGRHRFLLGLAVVEEVLGEFGAEDLGEIVGGVEEGWLLALGHAATDIGNPLCVVPSSTRPAAFLPSRVSPIHSPHCLNRNGTPAAAHWSRRLVNHLGSDCRA